MPYRSILEALIASVPGSQAALLLDVQGEVVVGAGELDERHRLIGAYQGIALGMASRTSARFEAGGVVTLAWRHEGGSVLLTTLRDGYYLVLALGPQAILALARRHSDEARDWLNREL
jgi:predicted regulator of Ras-like GTPase activity (Roadblock/LC7/MglB family)